MAEPLVEYPCWWTYAVIGADEEDLRQAIGDVAKGLRHRVDFSKQSAQKRYVSLHVEIWVRSKEERNRLFRAFQSHSGVRLVI